MRRLMTSRFIMLMVRTMTMRFIRFDKFVLVSKDLLFRLQKLKIRRSVLRHFVVILNFEFACHL